MNDNDGEDISEPNVPTMEFLCAVLDANYRPLLCDCKTQEIYATRSP
jgi:hypothetical protein